MRRTLNILVVLSAAVIAVVTGAQIAAAHSGLAAASPGPDAVVGGEVIEMQLFYGDFITTFDATVTSPSGDELAVVAEMVSDIQGTITLAEPLAEPGEYRVSHTITSIDTDIVESDYAFTFQASAPAPQIVFVPEDESGLAWWTWALIGVGAVVIVVLSWRLVAAMRRARSTA